MEKEENKSLSISASTNIDELKGYVSQLSEIIQKIEDFELKVNFGQVVQPVHELSL